MKPESVSVIIPTYNYGAFVGQAVESALAQRWDGAIEVIVVDDGSTDDTRERLAAYGDRIRYIYQDNKGLSAARNTGIRQARHEWIALLDSDDVWHGDKTRIQLEAVGGRQAVGFVGTPFVPLEDQQPANPPVRPLSVRDFLVGTPVTASSTMVRRRCFETAGLFDETLRSAEDREMWLRLSAQYQGIQVVSPCWHYREHVSQMSRRAQRMLHWYEVVLEKFFREHPVHRGLRDVAYGFMYLDASICFFDEGERGRAMGFLLRSCARWPWAFRGENREPLRRVRLLVQLGLGPRLFGSLSRVVRSAFA
jgi:glycosyltransferase involved in cell wall biosynthesis